MLTADPKHGENGLLEARSMLDLDLRAGVAALSACETARGATSQGEGMVGMSWALLVAGAASTVASEWRVDSGATERYMVAFHRTLAAQPDLTQKAQALRTAALDLLRSTEYRHPFYWGAFVLIGNGF
jgi:CHAT domain-containing protein